MLQFQRSPLSRRGYRLIRRPILRIDNRRGECKAVLINPFSTLHIPRMNQLTGNAHRIWIHNNVCCLKLHMKPLKMRVFPYLMSLVRVLEFLLGAACLNIERSLQNCSVLHQCLRQLVRQRRFCQIAFPTPLICAVPACRSIQLVPRVSLL
jgi:hypothetical protein